MKTVPPPSPWSFPHPPAQAGSSNLGGATWGDVLFFPKLGFPGPQQSPISFSRSQRLLHFYWTESCNCKFVASGLCDLQRQPGPPSDFAQSAPCPCRIQQPFQTISCRHHPLSLLRWENRSFPDGNNPALWWRLHAQLWIYPPFLSFMIKKQKPHLLSFIVHWCSGFHFFLLHGRRRNLILLIISFCICIFLMPPAPGLIPPHCTSMLKPLPSRKKKAILLHLPLAMAFSFLLFTASLFKLSPTPAALSSLPILATDIWPCCL